MSEFDVAILAQIKQGYIYKYMQANDLTQRELARRIGIGEVILGRIINFKWLPTSPKTGRGKKSHVVKKLEQYFGFSVEVLFPPELTEEIAARLSKKHVAFKTVELLQLDCINPKYLSYEQAETEDEAIIENLLQCLSPQEFTVIKSRFGLDGVATKTLEQTAADMRVCKERVRQIESKAIHKMRFNLHKMNKNP